MKRFSRRRLRTSMNARTSPPRVIALAAGLILATGMGATSASATDAYGPIAAKYHNDQDIANDPDVISSDDFESWKENGTQPPPGKWSVRKNKISLPTPDNQSKTISEQFLLSSHPESFLCSHARPYARCLLAVRREIFCIAAT